MDLVTRDFYVIQEINNKTGVVDYYGTEYDEEGYGDYTIWCDSPLDENVQIYYELNRAKEDLEDWQRSCRAKNYTFKLMKIVVKYEVQEIELEKA